MTDKGVLQSRRVASYINQRPDIIVHSPYIRTLQSARMTMDKFPDVPVEEWPVQEFIYLHHEAYRQTTQADRQPAVTEYWQQNSPALKASLEAESFIEFIDRMRLLVEKLVSRKGHVIIFTHGHVIRAMIWKVITGALNNDEAAMMRYRSLRQALPVPNAAILKITLDELELQMSQLITAHLEQ